jgi:hypothetical protein
LWPGIPFVVVRYVGAPLVARYAIGGCKICGSTSCGLVCHWWLSDIWQDLSFVVISHKGGPLVAWYVMGERGPVAWHVMFGFQYERCSFMARYVICGCQI